MPSRIIRESARSSPTLAKLSHGAERLFWRLITAADDYGQFEANPMVMRAECFKTMLKAVREIHVKGWLRELVKAGLVTTYRANGKVFGAFNTWFKYQRRRTSNPKYPSPPSAATGGELPRVAASCRRARGRTRARIGGMGYGAGGIGYGDPPRVAAGHPPDGAIALDSETPITAEQMQPGLQSVKEILSRTPLAGATKPPVDKFSAGAQ